jgi:cysteine desulfuration protein SufE
MPEIPEKLAETLDLLASIPDRSERIQALIDFADHYREVPAAVASRPFAPEHQVPACESQAFVFPKIRPDGALDFYFAVDNPQGISARAMAAILEETVSGAPLEQVAAISQDIVYPIFGKELSIGKTMGLMAMVSMVKAAARRELEARSA